MDQNTQFEDRTIYEGKWLHYKEMEFTVNNKKVVWEYVVRPPGNRGGVDIIPILHYKDKPDEILLIANFRPPIRKYCIEFPAGLVDYDGTIEENGEREVKEETGYECKIQKSEGQNIRCDPWKSTEYGQLVFADVDGDDPKNQNPQQDLETEENIKVYKLVKDKTFKDQLHKLAKENDYEVNGLVWSFALGLSQQ